MTSSNQFLETKFTCIYCNTSQNTISSEKLISHICSTCSVHYRGQNNLIHNFTIRIDSNYYVFFSFRTEVLFLARQGSSPFPKLLFEMQGEKAINFVTIPLEQIKKRVETIINFS